ncbi:MULTISPECIES: phosphatidate cytidylyltransferase [Paenibacillus]|nr:MULTISPECIES: phosphatidate cytidylyltransferase [Paenibacillus]KKC46731.1 phosphatidate cytidylyltransferase [Paenibacillus sp. D9]
MKQRIVTGALAGALFLLLLVVGGQSYNVLLLLLALIGFYEYVRLNGFRPLHPAGLVGYAGMLFFLLPWEKMGLDMPMDGYAVWILMFLLLAVTVVSKNETTLDGAALLLLGALYVGYGFGSMLQVRAFHEHGLFLSFLCFGCIWASDIGAYFIGKAIGRTKLWPAISPNKTIEGSLGGVLASIAVAAVFHFAAPEWIGLGHAVSIGLVAAVAGQFGDLIQSAYKRLRGVKDSGRLLPGHGGVLDRCDSWIIVFPLLVLTGLVPV